MHKIVINCHTMKIVKTGNARVKIYKGESGGYDLFTVVYYRNGKRIRENFRKERDATSRAQEIATAIEKGRVEVLQLTNSARESYVAAMRALQPLGIPLHAAVEEFIAAREHLGGESLLGAAKAYAKRKGSHHDKPVAEIVAELLQDKKQNGASARHIKSLRTDLNRFAAAFHCNIGSITARLIEHWLARPKVSPRTRNNNRASVVTLFRYARKHGYLSRGEQTEADLVDKVKDTGNKIQILSPAQMVKLMAKAKGENTLYLALGGFAGIRAAEIMRLEWKDFNFVRGHITVAADKAKTATRRLVPILPNLAEYLRPYHRATGHLFKGRAQERAVSFAKKTGINPWPINCLRHSYASYRLAATADAARVALELGNSPAKLFSNYRELADEHDAAAWFAISPKRSKKIVQFSGGESCTYISG
jgi:integrase